MFMFKKKKKKKGKKDCWPLGDFPLMNMLLLEKCLDTLDIKVTYLHYVNFVTIHILLFQHFPLCMDIAVSDFHLHQFFFTSMEVPVVWQISILQQQMLVKMQVVVTGRPRL